MRSNETVDWAQPRLNFDVLRLICNNLTKVSDVLSFALTCSDLRKGALQRRLSMSPVALSSPDSVERFHRFIFVDPTSRAPHLYGLSISPEFYYAEHEDPSCTEHLAAILEAATRLEYLYVPTSIILSVCTTIAKMTTIRGLDVFSDSGALIQHEPEALNSFLAALRSPLKHLSIADHKMGKMSAGFLHNRLFHLAPTLEALTLGDSNFSFDISPSLVTTSFTALRSLEISAAYQFDFYRMDVLLRLFPNLDHTLTLKWFTTLTHSYPTFRAQSMEAQKDRTWLGLDRVTLSTTLAFMLALRCPIRYMCIDESMVHEMRYLPYVLRDSCLKQLLLPIALFARHHLQYIDGLLIFPLEAAETLTHLVLFFEIEVNQPRIYEPEFQLVFMFGMLFGVFGFIGWAVGKASHMPWIGAVACLAMVHFSLIVISTTRVPYLIDTHGANALHVVVLAECVRDLLAYGATFFVNGVILSRPARVKRTLLALGIFQAILSLTCIPMWIFWKRVRSFIILAFFRETPSF